MLNILLMFVQTKKGALIEGAKPHKKNPVINEVLDMKVPSSPLLSKEVKYKKEDVMEENPLFSLVYHYK